MKNIYILLFIIILTFCQHLPIQKKSSQLNENYNIISYKTSHKPEGYIIQFDPVSLPLEILEKKWIPFWIKSNYEVIQIQRKSKNIHQPDEINSLLNEVLKNYSKEDNIILSGISLNGTSVHD